MDFGDGTDEEGFWEKGQFAARYPGMRNPWKGRGVAAPYDQRFYIVMNVAVGGVSGFFPDHVVSCASRGFCVARERGFFKRKKKG